MRPETNHEPNPAAYDAWLQTPTGQVVTRLERKALGRALAQVFGHYAVQVGDRFPPSYLNRAYMRRRFVLGSGRRRCDFPTVRCEDGRLPLATASVDAVVLPHTLEFSRDPRALLREVERVLVDDGQLFILTFNRLGWWGLRKSLFGRSRTPFVGEPYRVGRMVDWLEVLGFTMEELQAMAWRPRTLAHVPFLPLLARQGMPIGAEVCLLAARKRVAPLTPMRVPARAARRLVPLGLAEPAAREKADKPPKS